MKKILISQVAPCENSSLYCNLSKKEEIHLDFCPFIELNQVCVSELRKQKIDFSEFTSVIFTSKHAVDYYFKVAQEMRFKVPDSTNYFCQVEAIANYLQKYITYRKRKIYMGYRSFEDLMPYLIKQSKDEKYLLPSSDILKEETKDILDSLNINWTRVTLFNSVGRDLSHLDISSYYLVVFFTVLDVKTFVKNFPDFGQKKLKIAVFGDATYDEAQKLGFEINIKVPSPEFTSMALALEKYLE